MSDPRLRHCLKVFPIQVFVLLLFAYSLLHSMRVQAQVSQSSKVRALQEQRLLVLRNLVRITTEHYRQGQTSSGDLRSATRARDEAELDLCTSNAERIAIRERIVAEAKMLEEQDANLVTNKLQSETLLLRATADRLQQEILLEQARAK